MTVPDQTIEEAETGIKTHVQDLLNVKELIELESWRETQKALRRSSSYLKQDIYTLIQAKPGNQRPLLRKLYSELFNNVTRLDYAARSKDAILVRKCYENIVVALDDILPKL
ncbi:Photosystem II PsbQ [Macleaya cordata]|uniref:Photosystem II PsbQ n=1 Tax=Macleaya cordata TaxID=56857 RepID=A0A200QEU5_MACCD|nr:Photosystem II PsbQ [Macleaya cordata]